MRIGVDPGNSGAIALLNGKLECISVFDMPVMTLSDKKQQVNSAALTKIFKSIQNDNQDETLIVFLEAVHSMPGQGVSSMFNFGMGYGMVQGVLSALHIPFILVKPNDWKKRAGLLKSEKDKSRTVAQQLFPGVDLSLKKHTGRADALLIARYGEREND